MRIVDIGDADIVHTDTVKSHANIETGVRAILKAGAVPVVLGGDHSVNIPCIDAFSDQAPFHLVQIDAHLDFVDERHGVRHGHGNPMRRAAEKPWSPACRRSASAMSPRPPATAMRTRAPWDPTSSRCASSAPSGWRACWPAFPKGRAIT